MSKKKLLILMWSLLVLVTVLLYHWYHSAPTPNKTVAPRNAGGVASDGHGSNHRVEPTAPIEPRVSVDDGEEPARQTQESNIHSDEYNEVLGKISTIIARRSLQTVHLITQGDPAAIERALDFWVAEQPQYDSNVIGERTRAIWDLEKHYGVDVIISEGNSDLTARRSREDLATEIALLPEEWPEDTTEYMMALVRKATASVTPAIVRTCLLRDTIAHSSVEVLTRIIGTYNMHEYRSNPDEELRILYGDKEYSELEVGEQLLYLEVSLEDYLIGMRLQDILQENQTVNVYTIDMLPKHTFGLYRTAIQESYSSMVPYMEELMGDIEERYDDHALVYLMLMPVLRQAVVRLQGGSSAIDSFSSGVAEANDRYLRAGNAMEYRRMIGEFRILGNYLGGNWIRSIDYLWDAACAVHPSMLELGSYSYGYNVAIGAHETSGENTNYMYEAEVLIRQYSQAERIEMKMYLLGMLENVQEYISRQGMGPGPLFQSYLSGVWVDAPSPNWEEEGVNNGWLTIVLQQMLRWDRAQGLVEITYMQDQLASLSSLSNDAKTAAYNVFVENVAFLNSRGEYPNPRSTLEAWCIASVTSTLASGLTEASIQGLLGVIERMRPFHRITNSLESLAEVSPFSERIQHTLEILREAE